MDRRSYTTLLRDGFVEGVAMARKNEYGRFILSAGEIGAYTVCPEAWRLKSVARIKATTAPSVALGRELHREWASEIDEAAKLSRALKALALLIVAATIAYIMSA